MGRMKDIAIDIELMGTSAFALAVEQEKHPAVRHVLGLNAWKIKTWREYASWKKHATRWVAIAWQGELGRIAAMKGFEEQ